MQQPTWCNGWRTIVPPDGQEIVWRCAIKKRHFCKELEYFVTSSEDSWSCHKWVSPKKLSCPLPEMTCSGCQVRTCEECEQNSRLQYDKSQRFPSYFLHETREVKYAHFCFSQLTFVRSFRRLVENPPTPLDALLSTTFLNWAHLMHMVQRQCSTFWDTDPNGVRLWRFRRRVAWHIKTEPRTVIAFHLASVLWGMNLGQGMPKRWLKPPWRISKMENSLCLQTQGHWGYLLLFAQAHQTPEVWGLAISQPANFWRIVIITFVMSRPPPSSGLREGTPTFAHPSGDSSFQGVEVQFTIQLKQMSFLAWLEKSISLDVVGLRSFHICESFCNFDETYLVLGSPWNDILPVSLRLHITCAPMVKTFRPARRKIHISLSIGMERQCQ